ncbi:FAD-dependent monooxygenase [Pseudooceanicola sp. CBS1P-1]|uniref:3-hydroxybenzoate 4-monooxygenase n=1 Tax=Pseudooceanicola albus TaxID=2692189 RepID=A0A6L7G6D3_9RHOB|nr:MULTISPECIES: FAD-binding monooxygenase [Pseudooceanicola]MBT9384398.1 FAD-dependent monooxygenase [Pseudooceanicola endophyticus]MXN19864.1 3-hydroxybenzoate 4-monooxygenase [Pseudooceanicola albus]
MHYHLNGFRPGDPRVQPALSGEAGALPPEVDVLIVGCGPAGLTLAAQLAAFPEIRSCIVEKKTGPMEKGQADGVSCRSMEMFQAFGFANRVKEEAYWVNQTTFWKPAPGDPARIIRTGRVRDVEEGLSEMPHVILNQARVHDMYLEVMRNAPARMAPFYDREVVTLEATPEGATVVLRSADGSRQETVRARYVVGCDGARSTVRQAIGRDLRGESANQAWGVMDILAVTDFPDIRLKTLIQSEDEGTILIIPREGGYLVRLYVEQEKMQPGERIADRDITFEKLVAKAQRILHPYTLEVKDVVWWSVYQIGQRLTDRFDNAATEDGPAPSVFICGDACHTHSPKAGQGMNVSMGDGFNLGWKLAAVIRGQAAPALLHSYSAERQGVAQDLIDFDREWARIISERTEDSGAGAPQFQKYFIKQGRYTAGVAVKYAPGLLTGDAAHQALARGFEPGMRLHSAPVIRLGDAREMQLGEVIEADGRWRLLAFAPGGDDGAPGGQIAALCRYLEDDPASPLNRFTPDGADVDALFDLRAVFQQGWETLEITAMPGLLVPRKGRFGLRDYEKVFCARFGDDIFGLRGIDRARGALVVVRPDQYIARLLPLDDHAGLAAYFEGFLLPRR